MAITPPSERIWWKEPVHKVEIIWVIIAFLWGVAMFFTMIWWHGFGQQNMSNEAYRIQPFQFAEKVDAMVASPHGATGRRVSRRQAAARQRRLHDGPGLHVVAHARA